MKFIPITEFDNAYLPSMKNTDIVITYKDEFKEGNVLEHIDLLEKYFMESYDRNEIDNAKTITHKRGKNDKIIYINFIVDSVFGKCRNLKSKKDGFWSSCRYVAVQNWPFITPKWSYWFVNDIQKKIITFRAKSGIIKREIEYTYELYLDVFSTWSKEICNKFQNNNNYSHNVKQKHYDRLKHFKYLDKKSGNLILEKYIPNYDNKNIIYNCTNYCKGELEFKNIQKNFLYPKSAFDTKLNWNPQKLKYSYVNYANELKEFEFWGNKGIDYEKGLVIFDEKRYLQGFIILFINKKVLNNEKEWEIKGETMYNQMIPTGYKVILYPIAYANSSFTYPFANSRQYIQLIKNLGKNTDISIEYSIFSSNTFFPFSDTDFERNHLTPNWIDENGNIGDEVEKKEKTVMFYEISELSSVYLSRYFVNINNNLIKIGENLITKYDKPNLLYETHINTSIHRKYVLSYYDGSNLEFGREYLSINYFYDAKKWDNMSFNLNKSGKFIMSICYLINPLSINNNVQTTCLMNNDFSDINSTLSLNSNIISNSIDYSIPFNNNEYSKFIRENKNSIDIGYKINERVEDKNAKNNFTSFIGALFSLPTYFMPGNVLGDRMNYERDNLMKRQNDDDKLNAMVNDKRNMLDTIKPSSSNLVNYSIRNYYTNILWYDKNDYGKSLLVPSIVNKEHFKETYDNIYNKLYLEGQPCDEVITFKSISQFRTREWFNFWKIDGIYEKRVFYDLPDFALKEIGEMLKNGVRIWWFNINDKVKPFNMLENLETNIPIEILYNDHT